MIPSSNTWFISSNPTTKLDTLLPSLSWRTSSINLNLTQWIRSSSIIIVIVIISGIIKHIVPVLIIFNFPIVKKMKQPYYIRYCRQSLDISLTTGALCVNEPAPYTIYIVLTNASPCNIFAISTLYKCLIWCGWISIFLSLSCPFIRIGWKYQGINHFSSGVVVC
jgi:hypothetical protein